ncbi:hypothetical protein HQ38_08765 [Porphyromonas crevioricanis]|uniref:Uncharacterized protein n=1 Tax=Porphyromonas crevioricanis TaxID=393921 RepID=A0AB34PFD2_9PORP|nr:hypothetical protein HQ38_08765 [Porphyromonas crevioricanis]
MSFLLFIKRWIFDKRVITSKARKSNETNYPRNSEAPTVGKLIQGQGDFDILGIAQRYEKRRNAILLGMPFF